MMSRAQAVEALAGERFDLVVLGGGITGAGVALDAATRGYSVALVEKADFASGTSSRSSKLIHGGLRYLRQFDLGLVREALLERQLMVKLAPHLVTPVKLVVAAFDGARPDRLFGLGLNMYDVMATPSLRGRRSARRASAAARDGLDNEPDWSPSRHRLIDAEEVVALVPAISSRKPSGGYLFYDCQTDDARLVLTVLEEAERFGSICANRIEAVELRPGGVLASDTVSGESLIVQADNVINATGVWADRIKPEELHSEAEVPVIRPSRGTHITLSHADLPLQAGAVVPASGGRFIFALPWLGRSLIGTTDNDYDGDIEHVRPALNDVGYLLEATNSFFGTSLGAEDVAGAFAGVRPLISSGDSRKSVDISRKAELYETSSGLITITGGKLTTWRRMARLAVDRLVERDGRTAPCRTQEIPLGEPVDAASLPLVEGVAEPAYEALARRYGHAAVEVLKLASARSELGQPIVPGFPDLLVEAAYAARREQALTVGDVLLRRTRLGLLTAREVTGGGVPERVARAMAGELGWDEARVVDEAGRFLKEALAEGLEVVV